MRIPWQRLFARHEGLETAIVCSGQRRLLLGVGGGAPGELKLQFAQFVIGMGGNFHALALHPVFQGFAAGELVGVLPGSLGLNPGKTEDRRQPDTGDLNRDVDHRQHDEGDQRGFADRVHLVGQGLLVCLIVDRRRIGRQFERAGRVVILLGKGMRAADHFGLDAFELHGADTERRNSDNRDPDTGGDHPATAWCHGVVGVNARQDAVVVLAVFIAFGVFDPDARQLLELIRAVAVAVVFPPVASLADQRVLVRGTAGDFGQDRRGDRQQEGEQPAHPALVIGRQVLVDEWHQYVGETHGLEHDQHKNQGKHPERSLPAATLADGAQVGFAFIKEVDVFRADFFIARVVRVAQLALGFRPAISVEHQALLGQARHLADHGHAVPNTHDEITHFFPIRLNQDRRQQRGNHQAGD